MGIERLVKIERPLTKGTRSIDVGVNMSHNGAIIFNCAGGDEDLDGGDQRYKQIGRFCQEKGVGTFVRIGNKLDPSLHWPTCVLEDFRYVVDHFRKNGEEFSGVKDPRIFLMGYSAGAGIAAVVGAESSAEKMLLIALGGDIGQRKIRTSIESYKGELYILIGKNDYTIRPKTGKTLFDWAKKARHRELKEIMYCTHDFEGETNSRILSKAPLWAFLGDTTFPSPEGGIVMYDKGKGHFVPGYMDRRTGKYKKHDPQNPEDAAYLKDYYAGSLRLF